MTLRVLTWNIRQGGGTRLPPIAAALAQHEADVLVISEYRGGKSGERLRAALAAIGYPHATASTPPAGGNGFRIDHAFLSPALAARAGDVEYSHDERLRGLSDHSALILDLDV